MNKFLATTAVLAAIGASPANATLQIAAQIGPDAFFCADNTACDTTPGTGILSTAATTLDGVLFSSTTSASSRGALDVLNSSSLLIKNTTAAPVAITLAISDTSFTAPAHMFDTAGSGTWQGPGASFGTLNWFVDPANMQGAATAFDTPGVKIDDATSSSGSTVLGFAHNGSDGLSALAPFSMTEQMEVVLGPGESLVNRGQAMIASATVPEPSTWAMIGIGFALIGLIGRRRRQSRFAL